MPRPATVHAATPTPTGTVGHSTAAIPAVPISTRTSPAAIRLRPDRVWLTRACTQEPAVQDSVAPVIARLPTTGG